MSELFPIFSDDPDDVIDKVAVAKLKKKFHECKFGPKACKKCRPKYIKRAFEDSKLMNEVSNFMTQERPELIRPEHEGLVWCLREGFNQKDNALAQKEGVLAATRFNLGYEKARREANDFIAASDRKEYDSDMKLSRFYYVLFGILGAGFGAWLTMWFV